MTRRRDLWRRQALRWAIPLALLLANVVWFALFESGLRGRSVALDRALGQAREQRAAAASRLAEHERLWTAAAETRSRIERLYVEGFSTESDRLTETIRGVKELAGRAGLDPTSISYPEESLEEYGLYRRSFVFTVEGTYADLRTFLHLLELTPAFVTINQIAVGETSRGQALSVALRLSTFFDRAEGGDVGAPAGPPGPGVGGVP